MMRSILIIVVLAALPCIAAAQESDAVGTYVGEQLGVRGGQTVTLNLMPGGQATIAVAQYPGAYPLVSRGTWRFEGSGFVRVDIGGMAGSGTLYFHRYGNQLTATQDPFELTGFALQLQKLEAVTGTYTATGMGASGPQRLTLQLNQDNTASLTQQQDGSSTSWQGTWQTLESGDVQVTLVVNGSTGQMVFTRDGMMLRGSQWDRSMWGNRALVFVKG